METVKKLCLLKECERMSATMTKEEAKKLVDNLPEPSTWDDLMHEIFVRQTIEAGLADSRAGNVRTVEEVRRRFGLPA
jgi:hypothetical protein